MRISGYLAAAAALSGVSEALVSPNNFESPEERRHLNLGGVAMRNEKRDYDFPVNIFKQKVCQKYSNTSKMRSNNGARSTTSQIATAMHRTEMTLSTSATSLMLHTTSLEGLFSCTLVAKQLDPIDFRICRVAVSNQEWLVKMSGH